MFLMLIFFVLDQIYNTKDSDIVSAIVIETTTIILIFAIAGFSKFIENQNRIGDNRGYTVFALFCCFLFFPTIFEDVKIIISSLVVLLAFQQLISLQTSKAIRTKIFNASLLIFVACLFHFWNILFIALVFISIAQHDPKNYKIWLIPFVALIAFLEFFLLSSFFFNFNFSDKLLSGSDISFRLEYFGNIYENISFSVFMTLALFYCMSMISTMSKRPLVLLASNRKIVIMFVISILIFFISPNKSNNFFVFSFVPLSMMVNSNSDLSEKSFRKDLILYVFLISGLFLFFLQL